MGLLQEEISVLFDRLNQTFLLYPVYLKDQPLLTPELRICSSNARLKVYRVYEGFLLMNKKRI